MNISSKNQEQYPWWAGNARLTDLSNTFIVAHVAQAALMMLWAGGFTLFELAIYAPDQPMYTQGLILLPHLAAEGWGNSPAGPIANTYPFFAIGVIHLVAAGVLAFGAYFHQTQLPPGLEGEKGRTAKFHFEWDDPQQLGLILGHHLIILGLGAVLLVVKAMVVGGLYDTNLEEVRLVTEPTLDPGIIWDYRTHLFDVDNLEDLVGGHIYVAVLLILGGTWHILVSPFSWVKQVFRFSGDGILSYSLFGIGLAGFAASYYCGFNTLAYPEEFYGPALNLKSAFLPYYFDPNASLDADYISSRIWLANAHFYLAFFFLQGGLWHFLRAMGVDVRNTLQSWQQGLVEVSENPTLIYQNPFWVEPQQLLQVLYESPQADAKPLLKREQPFENYFYSRSQGLEQPSLTDMNRVQNTLYQTTYHGEKSTFYHSPVQTKAGSKLSDEGLYERPKQQAGMFGYAQTLNPVIYNPSHA